MIHPLASLLLKRIHPTVNLFLLKRNSNQKQVHKSYFYFLLSVWEIPYTFLKKKTSAIVSPTIAIVCILLICQKRNIELRPLAFFSKNLYLRCLAGME